MKQDEIKTDSQQGDAFYKALRENFSHTTDPFQDLAGYALNDFIGKYINELISKQKPSVSDEEIEKEAKEFSDNLHKSVCFDMGAKWMRDKLSLPPQVVQSEVSEEIKNKAEETYKHSIIEERAFQNGAKWALSLTPPDAEKWISVEEKPKEDIHCLVFLYNPNTNDSWQETAYTLEGYFHGVMGKQEYITHWMPLPKPPINKQGGK